MDINEKDLLLREAYARERTYLSLDRTLLSYIRTSLTLIVVGITFLKLFENTTIQTGGAITIFVAIFLTVYGISRTIKTHKKIGDYTLKEKQ